MTRTYETKLNGTHVKVLLDCTRQKRYHSDLVEHRGRDLDVEHEYWAEVPDRVVRVTTMEGALIETTDDEDAMLLQEAQEYFGK